MAEHKIGFTTENAYLGKGKASMKFVVHGSRKKMGTLIVSKGAVYWVEPNKSPNKKIKKSWEELRAFFEGAND